MGRRIVERRTVLKGGAAAISLLGAGASTELAGRRDRAFADAPQSQLPQQMLNAVDRFRETIPPNFRSGIRREGHHTVFSHEHLRRRATDAADDRRRVQQGKRAALRSLGPYNARLAAHA